MRVILLAQGTFHDSYQMINNASMETWMVSSHPNVKMFMYCGNYGENGVLYKDLIEPGCVEFGKELVCNCTDLSMGVDDDKTVDYRSVKFIEALEYCLQNYEFDYIFRTGNTSYVDVNGMYETIDKLPRTGVYGGQKCKIEGQDWSFIAGHNTILSRDLVEKLVNDKHLFINGGDTYEDIYIGKVITNIRNYIDEDDIIDIMHFLCLRIYDNGIKLQDPENVINNMVKPHIWNYRFSPHHYEEMRQFHKLYIDR